MQQRVLTQQGVHKNYGMASACVTTRVRRLYDPKYACDSIMGIAWNVGYRNKSSFIERLKTNSAYFQK